MTRVLALRALGLGDLLTGMPALRGLRRAAPHAELIVAMPSTFAPLLRLAGIDAEVHDFTEADLTQTPSRALPTAEFGVNLHGRGPESHRLLRRTCAHVIGFGSLEAGVDGPIWRSDEHECDRWCRLIDESLGLSADPFDIRLPAPPTESPGVVVVHPGASSPSRRWPAARYADVVRWLKEAGWDVVITGSAGERGLAHRVAGLSRSRPLLLAGETDVLQLAGLVAHAAAVVCGDTGVGHLAAAFETPSVHLYGPTSPQLWGPRTTNGRRHVVLWHGGAGDPHGGVPDEGLLAISVQEVVAALRTQLDRTPGSGQRHGGGESGYVTGIQASDMRQVTEVTEHAIDGHRKHHRHCRQGLQHHVVHASVPRQRPAPADLRHGRRAGR